eukprot:2027086-Amphidinium_carterae.1
MLHPLHLARGALEGRAEVDAAEAFLKDCTAVSCYITAVYTQIWTQDPFRFEEPLVGLQLNAAQTVTVPGLPPREESQMRMVHQRTL